MKVTKCIICRKEFFYNSYKRKCCSDNCLSNYRRQLTLKQRGLDYYKVIGKIEEYIIYNYNKYGVVKTLKECLKANHVSSKSFRKYCKQYDLSYNKILQNNNISRKHSKFQTSVTNYIRQIYNNYRIFEEMTFSDCINPKTNNQLKFDIYIEDINLIIECDGTQHYVKNSYFNNLALQAGYTPVYETDKIKEEYCNNHNIKLIRIPYSRIVTKEYVQSFLCI